MYGGYISIIDYISDKALTNVFYFGILGEMKDAPLFDKGYPYLASQKHHRKVKAAIHIQFKRKSGKHASYCITSTIWSCKIRSKSTGRRWESNRVYE